MFLLIAPSQNAGVWMPNNDDDDEDDDDDDNDTDDDDDDDNDTDDNGDDSYNDAMFICCLFRHPWKELLL